MDNLACIYDECAWCRTPCDEPQAIVFCDCPNHDGEDAIYCSRSCKVAHHG